MKVKKRDTRIELARLIACMEVVMLHIGYVIGRSDEPTLFKAFRSCIFADPVPVFWMITGFFIFNSSNYEKKWKNVIVKIICPVFFVYLAGYLLNNFLYGSPNQEFFDGMSVGGFFEFLKPLLGAVHPTSNVVAHTWYVIAYVLVLLFLPIVKIFVDWIDKSKVRQIVFLIVSLVMLIINDLTYNEILNLGFDGIPVVIGSYIFVIWGHIIYRHKDILGKRIGCIIFPLIFIGVNLVRSYFLIYSQNNVGADEAVYATWWSTSFSVVVAISVIGFSFGAVKEESGKINKLINYLSGFSYDIYLIHPFVIATIFNTGFFESIAYYFGDNPVIAIILSLLISFLIAFSATFVLAWIIREFVNGIRFLIKSVKREQSFEET